MQHNSKDCGVYVLLFMYHLMHGTEINGVHVPSSFRIPPTALNVNGHRLLWLEWIAERLDLGKHLNTVGL